MSDRFGGVLEELVLDAFPDGFVDDEGVYAAAPGDAHLARRFQDANRA